MASVTQTVTNYLGGVSNQPDDKKMPGQVKEALNAYPDPTFGLTKRPGLKFIQELTDGSSAFDNTDLDNAKWFYYNRDSDEKYIGCIVGKATSAYGEIHVWNTTDGVKATVTYGANTREYLGKANTGITLSDGTSGVNETAAVNATDYDLITIQDTTIIINKQRIVQQAGATESFTAKKVATVRINLVEYSSKYQVVIKKGGTTYTCTLQTKAGDTATNDADVTPFMSANDILTALKDGSNTGGTYSGHTGGLNGVSGITAEIIGTSIELTGDGAFTVESVAGGRGGASLQAYQDDVDNAVELAPETKHGRIVQLINTAGASDTYYAKFEAINSVSGPGIWTETRRPGSSAGLNNTTMPHKLYNTAKNAFTFSVIEDSDGVVGVFGTPRLVGDNNTNEHPRFIDQKLQQAFFYNNRLGFLAADNVEMSQAGEFFNFYMITAQSSTDADPIGISCSSTRPATLHSIVPTAAGLLLFSQNQQFILFSSEGNLTPGSALIRGISNYRMDSNIDPVDVGTHINFISKTHDTAGFTRVFGMLPQGAGQAPKVVDVGRVVAEYIPATVTSLTASPQNSFIAMYGNSLDKVYFYRTYSDGEKDIMQTWFNWQLPGNVHYVEVDSDTMYTVIKTGTGGAARYNLCSATMTQTPEETIIVTSEGQQVNPHMDFYKATSAVSQYPLESVTITNEGSGYSGTPTVTIAAPASGTQATGTAIVAGNKVTGITITNPGKGYDPANPPAVTFSGGGGSNAAGTAVIYDGSYCTLPFSNLTALEPVIVIAGNATSNFSGTTESGFTITPGRATVNSVNYFTVPKKDLAAQAANVYVGYKYNYDITLPKVYYRKDPEGKLSDYTAALTVARMKFSIGQSSVVGFKLQRKGVQAATQTFTGDGTNKAFSPDFDVKDKADVIVKKNGAKQILGTDYTIADHVQNPDQVTVTFTNAPAAATTSANVTTAADSVEIYIDQWYTLSPTQEANYYLGDDVPIETQNVFTVPIHQKSDNYTLRVFSDSPFPIALTSSAWEGVYSPRFYRRT